MFISFSQCRLNCFFFYFSFHFANEMNDEKMSVMYNKKERKEKKIRKKNTHVCLKMFSLICKEKTLKFVMFLNVVFRHHHRPMPLKCLNC